MKQLLFFIAIITSTVTFSQAEGWDKVIIDGKEAYMNELTGEISTRVPKGAARRAATTSYENVTNQYTGSGNVHRVERGDTFSKISRKYNVSLSKLKKLNNFRNFDNIEVGQEIIIGYDDVNTTSSGGNYHTVRSGETLFRISQNHGVSIQELKSLNTLGSNKIKVGQELRLR